MDAEISAVIQLGLIYQGRYLCLKRNLDCAQQP